ncbi:MAG TPA: PKD domain-containing protein [Solirubrobacterales bacterium]|nr:PKD domain-containing protein [Solirubrobacterales bacterium]
MALIATLAVAAFCAAGLSSGGAARAADPAIFDVGAASASINPDTPQYIGGYGYKAGPTMNVNDPLETRAFVVGKGTNAAVFVVADLTGWFAAYKGENLEPYGINRTREKIAAKLNERGYDITREDVIVSSTHVHAAPAVVGIWGTPDEAYLKKVSDAAVTAADEAAKKAKPSEIWTATGNVRSFVWQNGQGTNHPDGFPVDEDLPIMWAKDPETGATNGLYANVPNHPDQFNGEDANAFSADWTGYARKKLDELNGGTAVIGAGTLGRQEPPGSDPSYNEVIPQGEYVANEIQRTMAKATPLTSDTVQGSERYMQMVADNDELILAMNLYAPPFGACIDLYDICTIPRSTTAPYLTPVEGEDPLLGTYTSSIRIGDVIYSTNPGEAFAEVNTAIRDSIQGAKAANVVGLAGDFLGYYWVRGEYTEQQFGSSNFETYNVGPAFPQLNADKARENADALGFETTPKTVHVEHDADVSDRPGVQWYPDELESSDPTVNLYAGAQKSQDETVPAPATIHWDFDDGTEEDRPNGDRFDHTFPRPGSYEVTASVVGSNSKTRSWTETVTINPALTASAAEKARAWDSATLEVSTSGGSGKLIGAQWTCQDGEKLSGLKVKCGATEAGTATVVAADGAGNTATATVEVSAAPPKPVAKLKLVKLSPKAKKIRRGRSVLVKATFKNVGTTDATKAKACAAIPRKARKGIKAKPACRSLGTIAVGKTKTAAIRLKTTGKAKAKTVVAITATASDSSKATARMTLKTAAKAAKKAKQTRK